MAVNSTDIPDLIQVTIQKLLVTPLEQASTFLASGPRIFDTASPISIPKLTGAFSPGFVGESELITEGSGVGFDAVGLLLSTLKSIKTLARILHGAWLVRVATSMASAGADSVFGV